MKIGLIGAGAVGAYFIWGFGNLEEDEREFVVIAEGDRKERLANNGIKINGKVYHPNVQAPEDAGICDVIIMATKSYSVAEAAKALPAIVGEDTVVLSMLNGVDSEEIIAGVIGWEHVMHSVILIPSRRLPDEVIFDESFPIVVYYGAITVSDPDKKLKMVADAFCGTKMHFEESADILYDEWYKYARNICNNLPQAVVTAPAGIYTRSEHGRFLAQKLWDEVRVLAKLKGVILAEEADMYACADSTRYSTLQDIDSRRHTEVDCLCGYLMKLADENGIEVPYLSYTYHAIKLIEEKNDGKFE